MTLCALDYLMLGNSASLETCRFYEGVNVVHVNALRAVQLASRETGSCSYNDVRAIMISLNKSANTSNIANRLAYLCSIGLISREMKGLRFRYSITVQGVNLLYDMERALRRLRRTKLK